MDKKQLTTAFAVLMVVVVFGAIGSRIIKASQGADLQITDAVVDSIDIQLLESFPVQVHVLAKGSLPDGCTKIRDVRTVRNNNTFFVTITTANKIFATCTEALVPFKELIKLDVFGLLLGTYTVDVNGVVDTFTFDFDNVLQGGGKG